MLKRTRWYRFLVWASRAYLHSFWDFRTIGDLRVPLDGSVIVACTHQSHLDPWMLQACLTRRVAYVARSTLFKNPVLGAMLRRFGAIPFDRDAATATAMKDLAAEIVSGEAVAFFPEGTRTPDGEIGRIRPGIALLIRRTKVPVVPVAIDGAFDCWPRHQKIFRHGRVRVVVGEPITFPARADRKEILGTLRESFVALREEAKGLA